MLFVVLGVLLVALKLAEIGPPALWSWWGVLSPFAAAVVWWMWADMSGHTKRRAMDKMEEKKIERRRKSLSALGLDYRAFDKQKKAAEKFKEQRRREVDRSTRSRASAMSSARSTATRSCTAGWTAVSAASSPTAPSNPTTSAEPRPGPGGVTQHRHGLSAADPAPRRGWRSRRCSRTSPARRAGSAGQGPSRWHGAWPVPRR
jgi:small Trp-rich protein